MKIRQYIETTIIIVAILSSGIAISVSNDNGRFFPFPWVACSIVKALFSDSWHLARPVATLFIILASLILFKNKLWYRGFLLLLVLFLLTSFNRLEVSFYYGEETQREKMERMCRGF